MHMKNDPLLFFRVAAGIACFVVVLVGFLLARNHEKLVPATNETGGENDAQRLYATFIVFAIWAHAFVLTASFALFLH